GRPGPVLLAAIVVVSAAASGLALLLMAPRVYVAMSRDGLFPAALAATSAKSGTPRRATALLAAIASLYVLSGTFEQILALFLCTALAFVALAAAGLFRIRRSEGASAAFRCPGYPLTPALFITLLAAVAGLVTAAHPVPVAAAFALVALGLPVHRVFSASRSRIRRSRSA
ncbi:MAG: amino acid permease, partial [Thermoanaerobaculia bacterium]